MVDKDALIEFLTKQLEESTEQLEDEKRDVNLMLQTIRDAERRIEKLESELNYTTTERDNLFAQAKDDQRYIRTLESTIVSLQELIELGLTIVTNSQPDDSLGDSHRERYLKAVQEYIDKHHEFITEKQKPTS